MREYPVDGARSPWPIAPLPFFCAWRAVAGAAPGPCRDLASLARAGAQRQAHRVGCPNFKNTVTQQALWWQGPVAEDLAAQLAQ